MTDDAIVDALYNRQNGIFNPENPQVRVHIIGAGSIGSNLTYLLAKMGMKKLSIYDFDKVEQHNVPNQLYVPAHVDQEKVIALQDMLLSIVAMSNDNTYAISRIDGIQSLRAIEEGDIIVLALDSLDARKKIIDSIPDNVPYHIVDLRMGGEGHSGYVFTRNKPQRYLDTFNLPPAELVCGQQSILYTLWNCVSEGAYYIKQIMNGVEYQNEFYIRAMPVKQFIATKRVA